jgi:hypothetical protein
MASCLMPSLTLKSGLPRWLARPLLAERKNSKTLLVSKVSTLVYGEDKLDYKSMPS